MSKTFRREPIRIQDEDLPKARRGWGGVKPFTRVEKDRKKDKSRRACRNFKRNVSDDDV